MKLIPILVELIIFLGVRVTLVRKQVLRKNHIALFYASMIGFFFFFPFAIVYGPGSFWNGVVWITFVICLYALVGTVSYSVNPLFPKGIVRTVTVKKEQHNEKNIGKLRIDYEEQDLNSSVNLINHALKVLPKDISLIKNVMLKNGSNTMTYFDILISPQAIYHLYPCNWGGTTTFTNTGAKKTEESAFDTQDYAIKSAYASEFLINLLAPLQIDRHHIIPVIVLTNKTARIQGEPTSYKVVHVSSLESYFREGRNPHYTSTQIEEMKKAIMDAKK